MLTSQPLKTDTSLNDNKINNNKIIIAAAAVLGYKNYEGAVILVLLCLMYTASAIIASTFLLQQYKET